MKRLLHTRKIVTIFRYNKNGCVISMRNRQFEKPVNSEKRKVMTKSFVVSSVTCRRRVARTSSERHQVLSSRQIRNCMSGPTILSSRKNRSYNIKSLIAKKIANIINRDSGHSRIKSVIASLAPQSRNHHGIYANMRTKASDEIYRLAVHKRAR